MTNVVVDSPATLDEKVGAEVRAWLGRKGLTQRWLADQLNIDPMGVSRRLRGLKPFGVAELCHVAAALDITLAQLLGEEIVNTKNPHSAMSGGSGDSEWAPWGSNPRPTD